MLQNPATKQPLIAVPGHTHLFRRGATYYFRVGVPKELRATIGKREIFKSLRTTDFAAAKQLVPFESADANARIAEARRKFETVAKPTVRHDALSRAEIHAMVERWFIGLEKESTDWWEQSGQFLDKQDRAEVVDGLRTDYAACSGRSGQYMPEDFGPQVDRFLAERGIAFPRESAAHKSLCDLFKCARLENIQRQMDRVEGTQLHAHNPLFQQLFAHSEPKSPDPVSITLGELLTRYMHHAETRLTETTLGNYRTIVRIIREVIGDKTPLNKIARSQMEDVFATLKRMPVNAVQRYPGLTIQQTIAAAEARKDSQKLKGKTLENYFTYILIIFNFAVAEKLMRENPASYPSFREQFRHKDKVKKAKFTTEELQAIFNSPLYTECVNDTSGFATHGNMIIQGGRFWIPLLALYHGLRCNEACQLYTEDVCEEDGIPYLAVRVELDDSSETDKRLKNKSSRRNVPLHPEILRMGFMDFVVKHRNAGQSGRLFDELPKGKTGRYSNPFSKWFTRFLRVAIGAKPKATFHSFRHHFRDALRAGRVGDEIVEALGGWAGEGKQQREYGHGPSLRLLLEDIAKVEYPGLDLSHLYIKKVEP